MIVGSLPWVGVALALLSAAILAVGNLWQSRGVRQATEASHAPPSALGLLKTPIWLGGTAMFGAAILLQMGSLAFAPLILVQPIGVTALVFTALLTARSTGHRPSRAVVRSIAVCLVGVIAYVVIAALVSTQRPIGDSELIAILTSLGAVLLISLLLRLLSRGTQPPPSTFIVLGGIYSGFVATLGKTVILRVESMFTGEHAAFGPGSLLTIACLLGIGVASALSVSYVQFSHTCNPPDLVIAGLTVVDPGVAVLLGITILQEAAGAPIWAFAAFVVAGGVAFLGVFSLAKAENASSDGDAQRDGG